jgi:ribonuclease P protein component
MPDTFGKPERLKRRKQIDALFADGKSLAFFPIRVKFRFVPQTEQVVPVQAGVTASRKSFKRAVDRNRIKRLLRETYRLQKGELFQILIERKLQAELFFIYTDKKLLPFETINNAMTACLAQLHQKALAYENAH